MGEEQERGGGRAEGGKGGKPRRYTQPKRSKSMSSSFSSSSTFFSSFFSAAASPPPPPPPPPPAAGMPPPPPPPKPFSFSLPSLMISKIVFPSSSDTSLPAISPSYSDSTDSRTFWMSAAVGASLPASTHIRYAAGYFSVIFATRCLAGGEEGAAAGRAG